MQVKGITPLDLTNQVTVFVSTVGDKVNYDDCIAHLNLQDCTFRFEVIDHVAPMSAAFQTMIDRCDTPFYIQVDEDMQLYPYAVRILYDAISKASADHAIFCYSLWDVHMQKAIQGMKIYRTEIMRKFPYRHDVPNCDVEQNDRLKEAGFTVGTCWLGYEQGLHCIGEHGAHYTPETAYEAYYNRAVKSRLFPQWMSWARQLGAEFRQRVQDHPGNLVDLYALLGFTAGMSADLSRFNHEKDWRLTNHDFVRLQADLETNPPTELNLHVTSQCNLSCRWCARQKNGLPQKPDMRPELVKLALDKCPSIRSVCIAGLGEPLLCPHLESIVRLCAERQLYVGLITNGVLLTDFARFLPEWGVGTVSVSLNASTAESHERCNGSKTWHRVIEGIKAAVKAMPGRVATSMVCHRENVGEMPAFLDLAAKLGVPAVDFLTILPGGDQYVDRAGFQKWEIRANQQRDIDLLRDHPEAHRVRTWPVIRGGICPMRCRSPYVSVSMDSQGWVSPCRRCMPPGPEWGSIHAPCPPWRLPKWYILRAGLEGDKPMPEVCYNCFGNWTG